MNNYHARSRNGKPEGELEANANAAVKEEVKDEFDFSVGNSKFEKVAGSDVRGGYNKVKSFFDDISCDALDRRENNTFQRHRAVDKETFGVQQTRRRRY